MIHNDFFYILTLSLKTQIIYQLISMRSSTSSNSSNKRALQVEKYGSQRNNSSGYDRRQYREDEYSSHSHNYDIKEENVSHSKPKNRRERRNDRNDDLYKVAELAAEMLANLQQNKDYDRRRRSISPMRYRSRSPQRSRDSYARNSYSRDYYEESQRYDRSSSSRLDKRSDIYPNKDSKMVTSSIKPSSPSYRPTSPPLFVQKAQKDSKGSLPASTSTSTSTFQPKTPPLPTEKEPILSYSTVFPPSTEDRQNKLKYILCNNVVQGGQCNKGNQCWYSHSREEQKKYLIQKPCLYLQRGKCSFENCRYDHDVKPTPVDESSKIDKLCDFLKEDGSCKFGARCKYSHDVEKFKKKAAALAKAMAENPFVMTFSDSEAEEEVVEYVDEEGNLIVFPQSSAGVDGSAKTEEQDEVASEYEIDLEDFSSSTSSNSNNNAPLKRKHSIMLSMTLDAGASVERLLKHIKSFGSKVVDVNIDGFTPVDHEDMKAKNGDQLDMLQELQGSLSNGEAFAPSTEEM